jgi:nitrous oxidase accessory protein NosD
MNSEGSNFHSTMSSGPPPPFPACETDGEFVFVSYAHLDKDPVYEVLKEIKEVGAKVWYDEGIPLATAWKKSLVEAIEKCSGFIVMLTPHAIESENVAAEVSIAKHRKKDILCVYLEDLELRGELEWDLLRLQSLFHYENQELFEGRLQKFLEGLRRDAELRDAGATETEVDDAETGERVEGLVKGESDGAEEEDTPPVREVGPEPRSTTHVVDTNGGDGRYQMISDAVTAAEPHDTITIRPGRYAEELRISKPLQLIGEGAPGAVTIWSDDADVIQWSASEGRLANLTIEQNGEGGGRWSGVMVDAGEPTIEGCDITTRSGNCIVVIQGAAPTIRHNHLHHAPEVGISILQGESGSTEEEGAAAEVLVEDNLIQSNDLYGVEVRGSRARLTLTHNDIKGNEVAGVFLGDAATATIDGNAILLNRNDGISVTSQSSVDIVHNRIAENKGCGVMVYTTGKASINGNTIEQNRIDEVRSQRGSDVLSRDNQSRSAATRDAGVRERLVPYNLSDSTQPMETSIPDLVLPGGKKTKSNSSSGPPIPPLHNPSKRGRGRKK